MKKTLPVYLILLTLGLSACGSGNNSNPKAVTTLVPVPAEYAGKANVLSEGASTAGAQVFKTNCQPCHGPQGHGDGPAGTALDPAPKNLAELQTMAGDDYLFWRISTGREGTLMVAWKGILSDEQIWQVISFIRTLR